MIKRQAMWLMYKNGVDEGTLSGGLWSSAASLSHLKHPNQNKKARSTNLSLASTQFDLTLPTARSMRGALLTRTNFHQSGELKISGFSDSDRTVLIDTTDWVEVGGPRSFDLEWENPHFWSGREPRNDPDARGLDVPVIFDDPISSKYWRYEFNNSGHEDGYFSVGRVYMGTVLQFERNFSPGSTLSNLTTSKIKESTSRMPYGKRRTSVPQARLNFANLPSPDVLTNLRDLVNECGITTQMAVFLDPDAAALDDKLAFLGRLESLPDIGFEPVDYKSTSINIMGYP